MQGEFFTELSWKIMSHEIVPVPESGSSAQSKGLQAFLDALPNLTEAELHTLNHQVVERLRWFQERRRLLQMANFHVGDRVFFHDRDGVHIEGQILRLNSKTVSILADDSRQWNVPPAFLRLVKSVLDKS